MVTKLEYVTHQALTALESDVKKYEADEDAFVYALVVGTDCGIRDYIRDCCNHLDVALWEDLDDDDDLVPDIIIFGGDKMGMESGMEYINDTTVIIVEENEGGSLKRRNTSEIHAHAGKFNDYVYLDGCKPTIIVYSNIPEVITGVSQPFDPAWPTTTTQELNSHYDVLNLKTGLAPRFTIEDVPKPSPSDFPYASGNPEDWYKEGLKELGEDDEV